MNTLQWSRPIEISQLWPNREFAGLITFQSHSNQDMAVTGRPPNLKIPLLLLYSLYIMEPLDTGAYYIHPNRAVIPGTFGKTKLVFLWYWFHGQKHWERPWPYVPVGFHLRLRRFKGKKKSHFKKREEVYFSTVVLPSDFIHFTLIFSNLYTGHP